MIFSGSITAKAFGFDLWEIIVKWTQETFHFGYVSDNTENSGPNEQSTEIFLGLQTALDDYDIDTPLVPTWIPDGYTEGDIRIFDTPKQRQFFGEYQSGDQVIKVWVEDHLNSDPLQIEQSDSVVEVYSHAGIDYYIIRDNDQYRAAWIRDSFSCYISGPISVDELKLMINSIEEG